MCMVYLCVCMCLEEIFNSFSYFLLQTHALPGPALAALASLYVDAIKGGEMGSGKSLELFPTVLTTLAATETLAYGKGDSFLLRYISVCLRFSFTILSYYSLLYLFCFFFFRRVKWRGIQEAVDQ